MIINQIADIKEFTEVNIDIALNIYLAYFNTELLGSLQLNWKINFNPTMYK